MGQGGTRASIRATLLNALELHVGSRKGGILIYDTGQRGGLGKNEDFIVEPNAFVSCGKRKKQMMMASRSFKQNGRQAVGRWKVIRAQEISETRSPGKWGETLTLTRLVVTTTCSDEKIFPYTKARGTRKRGGKPKGGERNGPSKRGGHDH